MSKRLTKKQFKVLILFFICVTLLGSLTFIKNSVLFTSIDYVDENNCSYLSSEVVTPSNIVVKEDSGYVEVPNKKAATYAKSNSGEFVPVIKHVKIQWKYIIINGFCVVIPLVFILYLSISYKKKVDTDSDGYEGILNN